MNQDFSSVVLRRTIEGRNMAGLNDLIDTFPLLAPLANALGMQKNNIRPTMFGEPSTKHPVLGSFPTASIPNELPKVVQFYRADPTGKYGGKEGLETIPKKFEEDRLDDPATMYRFARVAGAAQKYGYPTMSPEEIVAFALKEGRADIGYNAMTPRNKQELNFDKKLDAAHDILPIDKNFLGMLRAKKDVANRKGITFAEAWNGTGINDQGQSGKDYSQNWEAHRTAAEHPKNKEFMNFIRSAYQEGNKHGFQPKQEKLTPYKKGGMINKPLQGGNKII